MDKLDAMQVFVRVAELASFTQAADSLGLPKGSISNAVSQLEARLGARLLHRTTRKVQLTQDGQRFYERCKDLLAEVDEVESLFQQTETLLRGRLRVDMPLNMAHNLVIPQLPEFMQRHPGIEIELSSTDRRVDPISEGFDCVVRVGILTESGLVARPLGSLEMVNCVSPAYIQQYGMPTTLEDLAEHYMVHYVSVLGAKPSGFEYMEAGVSRHRPVPARVTVNNSSAYSMACLAGLGIIQVPVVAVRPYLQRGELVEVLADFKAEPMPVSLLYPHRRHLSRRLLAFMEWLTQKVHAYMAA
ncbi:LysR family transcriptional regulator [Methylovorus menthalis]|uniref:LysR family transcriptional regulator n=1 Tax=Methylovorus menthalis TaxID=1002227 RepID=UPI001E5B1260|nr:LysR family transcriptional regulator [Methylovorus menthalis]MCB4810016.1 LysR family transcriptional regulator [Methylovorus menthalis]